MSYLARAALVLSALGLSGCMDLVTGGPLVTPGTPTGTIQFVNETSRSFDVILISGCDVGSYGLNRLPDDVVVPSGQTYSFTVSAGCWDVGAGTIGVGDAMQRLSVVPGGSARYTVTD